MRKHLLAVLAYVVATFATQAASHFGVNAGHYAAVTYLRAQPIFALGVLSMLIQGSIMAYLYAQLPPSARASRRRPADAKDDRVSQLGSPLAIRKVFTPPHFPSPPRPKIKPHIDIGCGVSAS